MSCLLFARITSVTGVASVARVASGAGVVPIGCAGIGCVGRRIVGSAARKCDERSSSSSDKKIGEFVHEVPRFFLAVKIRLGAEPAIIPRREGL